jgi:hypothetical protein
VKKRLCWCFLAAVVVLAPNLFTACEYDFGDLYIKFTANGQDYTWSYGYSEGCTDAFCAFIDVAAPYTFMAAAPEYSSLKSGADRIFIRVDATGEGQDFDIPSIDLMLEGTHYGQEAAQGGTLGTCNIAEYGRVDRVVEGNFTATVEGVELKNGSFRLYRNNDTDKDPPDYD